MKKLIVSGLVSLLSTSAFAQKLLDCNPPMGSSLQGITIRLIDGEIYRTELNMSGSMSAPVKVSAKAWEKKDLRWKSRDDGNVHLFQVEENGQAYWAYEAKSLGVQIYGDCEE